MSVPLRVGINARILHDSRIRGWSRYTLDLLAALARRGVELYLYSDCSIAPEHLTRAGLPPELHRVREAPPMRYLAWEQRWLPRALAEDRVDVFHSPFNFGLPWFSPCPRVLTLHDAIEHAYQAKDVPRPNQWNPRAIQSRLQGWRARARADRIITVSQHAKDDITRVYGIPPEKIAVTYEAADEPFHRPVPDSVRAEVRGRHELPGRFVFYIGGWEGRKNVPFLVRSFAAANPDGVGLVLAGAKSHERAAITELAASLGISDRVRLLGWVEDEDLPALYSEAMAFVYPSLYEGFGLQLCEAMACRCPTLASRATCLPEVLGDGGETFSLDDTSELASLLRRVADDPAFRSNLVDRAGRRSRVFTWDETADRTIAVYRDVIANP
ncbi:MAG: glycosyltransferase family 1 protein [Planctomycetota bacterium]|nr:glycosyltransferase family 1 protein [Planctomycetota bacterium]